MFCPLSKSMCLCTENEGFTVGTFDFCWMTFMCADFNLIQRTEVFVFAVVFTFFDGTLDTSIFTHKIDSFQWVFIYREPL